MKALKSVQAAGYCADVAVQVKTLVAHETQRNAVKSADNNPICRAHSFSADSKWSWSMAQPSAWEWRQQNAAKSAEHLKTPKPIGRPAQLSCGPPDEAAACNSQALQQEPGQPRERASAGSADACGWKHGAPAQELQQARAQEGQAAGLNTAQMLRTMAGKCVSVGKGALAGLVTRSPSMRVSKRLKFSGPEAGAKQDVGVLRSPACASALAAFTAQLAKPDLARRQMQSQAAADAGAAGVAASCGGVSVEVREVHVSRTAGSPQQQAGQGGAPAQQQGGGTDPARYWIITFTSIMGLAMLSHEIVVTLASTAFDLKLQCCIN